MYKRETARNPCVWNPQHHGWTLQHGKLTINSHEVRQVLDNVCSNIDENSVNKDEEEEPMYRYSSDEEDDGID